ncbi:MAG: SusC/RagA family TonB-linked outer membrane protein [Chitinophagaceae bacterium]|nr:MAG: SusC/RagA family TonB-linked outer membrane protein [Chitinophagaceae bacterium]
MKLIFLFTFVCCMQASAKVFSQDAKIDLNLENTNIKKALRIISQKSEYRFLYNNDLLPGDMIVSISAKQETVPEIIKAILGNTGLTFHVLDDNLIAIGYQTQSIEKVTGTVSDSTGHPLVGVTIQVKGTTVGTVTDANGNFSIDAPENSILLISYIGYQTKEVHVNGQTQINIVLQPSATGLNEVVVTALGIKRQERELGYATQEIKGNTLETVKGIDVGTSLTGRVSGLMVKNSPDFMSAPDITMRGETPLLVIDGVPYANMTLREVPADDIESINFLKGATASALYGSRGGSGAVMVTTKHGAGKKGFSVSVNSSSMFQAGYLAIPEMQSRYGRVVNTATNTYVRSGDGSWGAPLDGQEVIQWDPISKTMKPMPFIARGKDNFQNFLRQGYVLNNNVSVSQVGDMGGFRASATWVQNRGAYPNARFDKITYSVGGDIKFNRFTLTTSLAYNNLSSPNMGFNGYTGYDPMYSMLVWGSPDWNIKDYKDYWVVPNEVQNSSYTAGMNNPYFDRFQRTHSYKKDVFNGQFTANYEVTDWLKAMVRTGYDNYSNKQDITISEGSFQGGGATKVLNGGTEVWGESQRGSYNVGIGRGFSTNTDAMLLVNKNVHDFSIDGFLGGSIFYQQNEGMEAMTQGGLSIPAFYSLKASMNPVYVNSLISKNQINSFYGKLGVGWKNMAFVEGTFRNDWASTLPKATRSYLYPSVSGSFIPSELFQTDGWLSYWKLRGSWTTYKTPAGIYDINNVYTVSPNSWGTLSSASFPTSIRPSNIHAEGSSSTEIGTNASFLDNRISLDVTLYKKRMYDFIVKAPISPSSGFTSVYTNSNEERTRRGIELTLNATPVRTRDFSWDVSFNWTKYATFFTRLDSLYSVNNRDWVKVGKRADYSAINQYQTDNKGNIVFNNGVPTYKPILSLAGYTDPDWVWGFNTNFHYKNFSLSMSMDGRVGGLAQSTTEMYMWISGNHPNSLTEARYKDATNAGSKNFLGEGVKVVSGAITYDANYHVVSDTREFAANDVYTTYKSYITALHKGTAWGGNPSPVDLYSTTFFKLREVALTYQVPAEWTKKIKSKGIAVSLIGQNLLYWAKQFKYSDIDGGTENFSDPSIRYVGFDIKLDF